MYVRERKREGASACHRLSPGTRRARLPHLVLERAQVAGPGVGVAVLLPLLAKVSGHVAVDDGLHQCDALHDTERPVSVAVHHVHVG